MDDELQELRRLVGPEADNWTAAQLEELNRDADTVAALLLDLYRFRNVDRNAETCGLSNLDVQQPDR
jgi:hypothetical protein